MLSDAFRAALVRAFEAGTADERAVLYVLLQAGEVDVSVAADEEVGMRAEQLADFYGAGWDRQNATQDDDGGLLERVRDIAYDLRDLADEARRMLVAGAAE